MNADVIAVIDRLRTRHLLELVETIARAHHVEVEVMLSKTRLRDAVRARHALWATLHGPKHSYASLAELFGAEHTSVRSGVMKHRERESAEELSHYEHERLNGLEARIEGLERLSLRLEKACDTIELLAVEMRRAS